MESKTSLRSVNRPTLFRRLFFVIRVAIVVGGLAYVVYDIDLQSVFSRLSNFSPLSILLLLAIGFLQYLFQGLRLVVLSQGDLRLRHGVAASIVCVGLNMLLPAKIGELAKIAIVKCHSGVSLDQSVRVVFWERFLDMNMLSVLCFTLPFIVAAAEKYMMIPIGLTLVLWGGCWVLIRGREAILRLSERISQTMLKKGLVFVVSALGTLPSWTVLLNGALVTVLVWGAMFLLDATAVSHVAGLKLTIPQLGVVFVLSVVGYSVPSAPGAIGIFDAALVLGLGWFGVSKGEGLAVALLLRVVHYVPSISFTFVYMLVNNIGLSDFKAVLNSQSSSSPEA